MNQGQIVQRGSPEEVYGQPASRFVAEFLGLTNLIDGQVIAAGAELAVATPLGTLVVPQSPGAGVVPGTAVTVLIRPDAARLCPGDGATPNCLAGQVVQRSFRGGHYQVGVQPVGQAGVLRFNLPAMPAAPAAGEALHLVLDPAGLVLVPG
jgi:putative spermidine/putrescine transport system ATP-binding protein